jgi:SAM-dependent methyltransferase
MLPPHGRGGVDFELAIVGGGAALAEEGAMDRDDPAYRGQADYSRTLLRLYDPLVLGPIVRFVWRFPTQEGVRLYQEHIRPNHLDVGPGTGYFLVHAGLPKRSKVTILDPNPNVLRHVTERLQDLDVTAVQADVLKPLPVAGPFDSAALSAVLHCLPGPMERKAIAIANVARVMAPDGVLFGASVLGRSGRHTRLGRAFLWAFNKRGAFGNLDDTEAGLRDILERSFRNVTLETIGGVALFVATYPLSPALNRYQQGASLVR